MKFVVCLLFVKISSFATKEQNIDDIINQDPLTRQYCKVDQFDCGNYKCIDPNLVCDGKEDCTNGNDEHNEYCVIDHKNASCAYPNVPPDRYEFSMNFSSKTQGRVPEFVQGKFKCKEGYSSNSGNEIVSRCFQRSWEPPIMLCQKTCPVINTPELEQTCFNGGKVDCNGIIWERTRVRFTCRKMYHKPTFKEAFCLPTGKWNLNPNLIECRPMCGHFSRETVEALQQKDFPWRVIIREQIDSTTRYFSGTLIDTKMVLTDGNLLTRSKNLNNFSILINDDLDSWGPPKSYEVKNIHFLPQKFQKFFSPDGLGYLAILESLVEIEFSLIVLPACIKPYSYPASLEIFHHMGLMIALDNSEEINRDGLSLLWLKTLRGTCKINREKCNQYYGQLYNASEKELIISNVNRGAGLMKSDKELKLYFLEGVYSGQDAENSDLLIFTFAPDYVEWIDEIREKIKHNNITLKNENKSIEIVNQLKDTTRTATFNLLTIFVLLSFVILIAVLFRIK